MHFFIIKQRNPEHRPPDADTSVMIKLSAAAALRLAIVVHKFLK